MEADRLVQLLHSPRADRLIDAFVNLMQRYFRVEVQGLEHIPAHGPVVVVPNHSGYAAADAVLLAHIIHERTRRQPKILAHRAFFRWLKPVKLVSESFGLREAHCAEGVELLKRGELLLLFPEGERGNFKPSRLRYRLQEFHSGFVRMALASRATIVACLVVGAEDSHLNLGMLDLSRYVRSLRLPLPLNLLPLPAKWRITFLPPVSLAGVPKDSADDYETLFSVADGIRAKMQEQLDLEVAGRPYIYTPMESRLLKFGDRLKRER